MRIYLLVIFILLTWVAGCSGSSPLSPTLGAPYVNHGSTTQYTNNHVLWGIWNVSIDPETMSIEAVPLRGADFTCNVLKFMQPPLSPINMIQFTIESGSNPINGLFVVKVTLRHPFPGMNFYNGFDVRGILLANGSMSGIHDSSVLRAGSDDTRLLNADGHTRWWNYPEFTSYGKIFGFTSGKMAPPNQPTATVNPYKYFAQGLDDDLPVTGLDPSTRGFFPTIPGIFSRTYEIQFRMNGGKPAYDFQYAVDASWDVPDAAYNPDYPVKAFPLSANCHEAYALSADDSASTAWYLNPTDNGGELVIGIEIFDHQAMGDPMGVPGQVSGIWLEGDILGGAVDVLPIATVLPGSTVVSSVFEVTISSLNITKSGSEPIFCTVESVNPSTYKPQIPGGDAFDYPDAHLAAYFTFDVEISGESPYVTPTVLSINPDWGYVDDVLTGVNITGSDFDPACTAELKDDLDNIIQGVNLIWVDSGHLEVDLDLNGANLGLYDVIVANPVVAPGMLEDGFEVKEYVYKSPIWPVTQGNPQHTGYVGLNGPSGILGAPSWNVKWGTVAFGNALPTFLNETTIFTCISFNFLATNHLPAVAINMSDHSIKWETVINETSHSSVVTLGLSAGGDVVLVWDWPSDDVYGLDAEDGGIMWGPITAATYSADAYASLDLDGNFIIPSETGFMSVEPYTGTINWKTSVGNLTYCTPAVGPDGTIYGTAGAKLYAFDPSTGENKWSSNPGIGLTHNGLVYNPVTNNIIVYSQSGLFSFADEGSSGSLTWQKSYPYAWYCSPAVAGNGDIYLVDGTGTLRRIDPLTGDTLNSSGGYGGGYGTRPAIGEDGLIYLNNESNFRCANPDCTLKWSFYGGWDSYWGAPAIGQDGTVYSARRTNGLCAWND